MVDTNKLEQLLFLDETHRSQNASRRRRHSSKYGVTPVSVVPFYGRFDARFTMIAACDINGFIKSACDVIERESMVVPERPIEHAELSINIASNFGLKSFWFLCLGTMSMEIHGPLSF